MAVYNPYDPYGYMQNYADQGWATIANQANQVANQGQYWAGSLGQNADVNALARDKFNWEKQLGEAGMTGQWNGQWSMPSNQWFANTFGAWAPPTAGQQTLGALGQEAQYLGTYNGQQTQQAQQQAFGQGMANAALYGTAFAPGQGPTAGQQTMAAQQQAFAQEMANKRLGLDTATQQQQAANQYLTLLSSLRGPADWAKYQQVLGAGGNMNSLAAAAMGQYVPGGGATSGVQPQAANLNTLMGQVQGAAPQYPGLAQGTGNPYQLQGQGQQNAGLLGPQAQAYQQQQAQQYYGQPGTSTWTGPNANVTPGYETQYQQMHAQQNQQYWQNLAQQQQAAGNGTNTMGAQAPGAPQANQYNLPAPNQVAAQSWRNFTPSQQQMMLGDWESQGWHKPDVEALMNQSLPKYGSNASTAGTWRLR